MDPALDIAVVAALIVALLLVAVVGIVGEEVRVEVAADFLVYLPADLDGLVVAEGGAEAADLKEGEIGGGLDVRGVAGYDTLAAIIGHRLRRVCVAVDTGAGCG